MTTSAVRPRQALTWALNVLTADGLVIDSVIHLQLADLYQMAAPAGIGQGNLFRVESVLALVAAIFLLLKGNRIANLLCLLIAASALAAVLLYRYVDIGPVGPVPSMYEPLWFTKKTVTAIAEAVSVLGSVIGTFTNRQSGRPI